MTLDEIADLISNPESAPIAADILEELGLPKTAERVRYVAKYSHSGAIEFWASAVRSGHKSRWGEWQRERWPAEFAAIMQELEDYRTAIGADGEDAE